jgi:hypothetical protein
VRHRHPMPFGAEVLENGEIRFSLWAPAAETVELILEGEILPMRHEEIVPRLFGGFEQAAEELLHATGGVSEDGPKLPGWSVAWYLREAG